MSQTSPTLSLPYLQPSQAQKHVTHNEALDVLDLVVQLCVQSFDDTDPPATPAEGDVYVPASGATGAWAGRDGEMAVWRDGIWQFLVAQTGWRAWDIASEELRVWTGSAWAAPVAATDNLDGLGVGTSADATNVLAVAGPATLLSHSGTGHQLKINKAADGQTASLLFQSNWSGHAEMGLAGTTDFSIKVSPDGSAWTSAMVLDAGTGQAGFGADVPLARLHARETADEPVMRVEASDAGYSAAALEVVTERSANAAFDFARFSSNGGLDAAFVFAGDGNGSCDGSWSGGGADYAEYFEWADGNPEGEDRRGLSVVLDGDKIRPAEEGESPIGVISGMPSIIGDADAGRWKGKYLRDAFGSYITETVTLVEWQAGDVALSFAEAELPSDMEVPEHAQRRSMTRRVQNPEYVEGVAYVPRGERAEWAVVGLMGKLRVRSGQPVGDRWLRMRRVADAVEEWLVR